MRMPSTAMPLRSTEASPAATNETTQIQPLSHAQPSQVSATQTTAATPAPMAGTRALPYACRRGSE